VQALHAQAQSSMRMAHVVPAEANARAWAEKLTRRVYPNRLPTRAAAVRGRSSRRA
jgi:hypothetical protein